MMVSHGTEGSPWVYRDRAHYLAGRGVVVSLPEYPLNNRNDNARESTVQHLTARPHHLQLALHHLLECPDFAGTVNSYAVGLIGHSVSGYTALALADGTPAAFSGKRQTGHLKNFRAPPMPGQKPWCCRRPLPRGSKLRGR